MKLYLYKTKPTDNPYGGKNRKAAIIGYSNGFLYFGLYHQYKNVSDWRKRPIIEFCLNKYFRIGSQHVWYDGPNCSFSLGFLHINRTGNIFTGCCKKCE